MRHRKILPAIALIAFSASALATTGCASSPKSGKGKPKRVVLSTEYDDARVGRDASVDVKNELGALDNAELDAYVGAIGRKLLRGVPRKSFDYQFTVIDQEEPNAFALPGGYIFVSRGLLALANNEDEVACVLGHEIIHAAKRHAAAQQALAGAINPLAMPWNRAASMAAYGRDMERDADKGGQILCAAAGYDPMAMSTFLESLEQLQRLQKGYSRRPSFFDTHPGTKERVASNAVRAGEIRWRRDPNIGDSRAALLAQVDGLPVGQRPETGIFEGDSFLHPTLDFHIRFPDGWRQMNANQAQDRPHRLLAQEALDARPRRAGRLDRHLHSLPRRHLARHRHIARLQCRQVPGADPLHDPQLPPADPAGEAFDQDPAPAIRPGAQGRERLRPVEAHGKRLEPGHDRREQRRLRRSPLRGRGAGEDRDRRALHREDALAGPPSPGRSSFDSRHRSRTNPPESVG
jgi:hypothetical protein